MAKDIGSGLRKMNDPLPQKLTAEQAAAVVRFGQAIVRCSELDDRLQRETLAALKRSDFKVIVNPE
jgi:hypothetical protein